MLCLFFLTLGHARSHLCHVRSVCFFHLVCFTHLVDKRGALEQERTSLYHLVSVKVLCVFFLTLGHERSHLCHVRSVCSSHLLCSTHLADKRGTLEQERTSLYHVRFSQSVVSVFLNPWASKIPSMPCSFSVFLPSCLFHASRGQTLIPRESTTHSLPCQFSQSLL